MQKRFRPAEILKAIETYKVTVAEPPATLEEHPGTVRSEGV